MPKPCAPKSCALKYDAPPLIMYFFEVFEFSICFFFQQICVFSSRKSYTHHPLILRKLEKNNIFSHSLDIAQKCEKFNLPGEIKKYSTFDGTVNQISMTWFLHQMSMRKEVQVVLVKSHRGVVFFFTFQLMLAQNKTPPNYFFFFSLFFLLVLQWCEFLRLRIRKASIWDNVRILLNCATVAVVFYN